jgi:putative ABC transport system permease protein
VIGAVLGGVAMAAIGGIAVLTLFDLVARPTFRRLAFRNIARRPAEAVRVVVGSLLGTAIITAAFIVGDTFDASIRDFARTELGPVDQQVRAPDAATAADVVTTLQDVPIAGVEGWLTMTSTSAAVTSGDAVSEPAAEPAAVVGEADLDAARRLGADVDATGLADAGATPTGVQAVLNDELAETLGVGPGDDIVLYAYGQELALSVRDVVPKVGLAGYVSLYVPPGTIERLAGAGDAPPTAQPPTHEVLVSNEGGVFDGADLTDLVVPQLQQRVAALDGVEVRPTKQELLDLAAEQGESIGQLFTSIGAFSVLVGVLLLVNLFVMLAEERKGELGMLRAVGLKRNHLMRSFGLEGAAYSLAAALCGGLVGIGVGAAIVAVTRRIVDTGPEQEQLNFVFAVQPSSLVVGVTIGLTISLVTVWATSTRIARLNVIRAIRDLPEPSSDRVGPGRLVLAGLGAAVGLLLSVSGTAASEPVPTVAGPPLVLLALIPLTRRFVGRRPAVVGAMALTLVWAVGVFSLLPEVMENPGVEVFVVQGVIMVGAAVGMISQADRLWARLADRASNGRNGLALRLALAYPLARTVRTGIQLAMFSLVVFTMTFMAVFSGIFSAQAGRFADIARGGAELFVDSNPANPVTVEQLEADDEVARAVPLLRGIPQFTTDWQPDPTFWPLSGIDERLLELGPPQLTSWDPTIGGEAEVWQAVAEDPTLAVVPDWFLQTGGGPPSDRMRVGDRIDLLDPTRPGTAHTLVVAGMVESDWVLNGVFVGRAVADEVLGPLAVDNRHVVSVAAGADPGAVADRLTADLVPNGGQAETFLRQVEERLAQQTGFFQLMQGYLALGLLIGIAGLGVVMVRAVRERRRQIGMLRAMGLQTSVVRRAFLIEAGFIAAQGIVVGIGLGLVVSYQVLTLSATFGDQPLPYEVPWVALSLLFVIPLLAAMAAAVTPAGQAARIQPAAALRIAE